MLKITQWNEDKQEWIVLCETNSNVTVRCNNAEFDMSEGFQGLRLDSLYVRGLNLMVNGQSSVTLSTQIRKE